MLHGKQGKGVPRRTSVSPHARGATQSTARGRSTGVQRSRSPTFRSSSNPVQRGRSTSSHAQHPRSRHSPSPGARPSRMTSASPHSRPSTARQPPRGGRHSGPASDQNVQGRRRREDTVGSTTWSQGDPVLKGVLASQHDRDRHPKYGDPGMAAAKAAAGHYDVNGESRGGHPKPRVEPFLGVPPLGTAPGGPGGQRRYLQQPTSRHGDSPRKYTAAGQTMRTEPSSPRSSLQSGGQGPSTAIHMRYASEPLPRSLLMEKLRGSAPSTSSPSPSSDQRFAIDPGSDEIHSRVGKDFRALNEDAMKVMKRVQNLMNVISHPGSRDAPHHGGASGVPSPLEPAHALKRRQLEEERRRRLGLDAASLSPPGVAPVMIIRPQSPSKTTSLFGDTASSEGVRRGRKMPPEPFPDPMARQGQYQAPPPPQHTHPRAPPPPHHLRYMSESTAALLQRYNTKLDSPALKLLGQYQATLSAPHLSPGGASPSPSPGRPVPPPTTAATTATTTVNTQQTSAQTARKLEYSSELDLSAASLLQGDPERTMLVALMSNEDVVLQQQQQQQQ
eukprot:Sspe_Gene.34722::Locus_16854_Transcript_1_1_Confidence_1.000_Length_1782::g.34722::m.34722